METLVQKRLAQPGWKAPTAKSREQKKTESEAGTKVQSSFAALCLPPRPARPSLPLPAPAALRRPHGHSDAARALPGGCPGSQVLPQRRAPCSRCRRAAAPGGRSEALSSARGGALRLPPSAAFGLCSQRKRFSFCRALDALLCPSLPGSLRSHSRSQAKTPSCCTQLKVERPLGSALKRYWTKPE